jgi:hypothetical protein
MNQTQRPTVTIGHELPGRLRLRLSHPIEQVDRMRRIVAEHVGIDAVRYTAVSRSVLVTFDPDRVSAEEILIRVAMSLSLETGRVAVRILARPQTRELTDSAFYSGLALLAALGLRVVRSDSAGGATMDWVASLGTAGAALEHGWMEYRQRGNFDPEVLSVAYLLTSLLRRTALPAAIFTWITTFGRHLARLPMPGVEVHPVQVGGDKSAPRYEVVIAPDRTAPDKITFFGMLPTMLFNALTGAPPEKRASLLDEIRRVSNMHDQVLEGVSDFRHGIPLRIR